MKITYDKEADAMYVYFRKGKIADTFEIGKDFIVDVDSKGSVLGLEILDASRNIGYLNQKPSISIGDKSLRLPALVS